MLANAWKPVAGSTPPRGLHRSRGWELSPRLLGSLTVTFSLVASLAVVIPNAEPAPVLSPAVMAFETASTTLVMIPPTSVGPSITTRPTLGPSESAAFEAEVLALAARPIRAEVGLAAAEVEYVATTIALVAEAVETADLSVLALELQGVSGRAVASEQAVVVLPVPQDPFECHERASELPLTDENGVYDRNLVAQMVHTVFECVASVGGLDDVAPTTSGWDAAAIWGFEDMSRQVAAEAVVVGYCESIAFVPSSLSGDNPWGYGGVFQMGDWEMGMFGFPGASKFDPVDNTYSAATYFMSAMRRGAGWGGWGPWAVVNTGYDDEVNDRVKVPVLPRFTSTDPDYRGRRGVELPEWAVDPWSWQVPSFQGCPTTGRAWPEAQPLA